MSFRNELAGRTIKEWSVRLLFAIVAIVLGYNSLTFSIAQVVVGNNPVLAHRLAPNDGRITARLAASLSGDEATLGDRARADATAKLALRQDPINAVAFSTLGVNADVRGERNAARAYFSRAQRLSRRDVRTQLWMIEDKVAQGNIPSALHEYDMTLRVFPELEPLLYPVLATASADPAIRGELVKTIGGRPPWTQRFLSFIAEKGNDPASTAMLFRGLGNVGVAVPAVPRANVVNALIGTGKIDQAWAYYASMRPGADRRRSRDPRFSATLEAPSHLDWEPSNDGGLATGIQGGIFDFSVPASVGGVLIRQLQILPPGSYRLVGHSMGIEQTTGGRPYWTLTCPDGHEVGRIEVPNSNVAKGNFEGIFSVPANCPIQTLTLIAQPSDAMEGVSGQLNWVELAPSVR